MTAVRWVASAVVVLFGFLIVNGWQHGHYDWRFVLIVAVGLLAAYVRGFTDAN